MSIIEEDPRTFINSLNQSIYSINVLQNYESFPSKGSNMINEQGSFVNKNHLLKMFKNDNEDNYKWKEKNLAKNYQRDSISPHIETTSLDALPTRGYLDRNNNQATCVVPPYYTVPLNEFNIGPNVLHPLVEIGSKTLQINGPKISELLDKKEKEKIIPQDIQDLIYALQTGSSRCKMEAAITVRSLATSHHLLQSMLIEAGGIGPLVDLLKYKADEVHWPMELKEKATITVRAEAALALASLSVSNDDNKDTIGIAGAIPLLCELIHFDENNHNHVVNVNYYSQEMAPFFILARDAGAGALSYLSKSEKNKEAIIATQVIPILVCMIDQGTSFGRVAAANVIAKLATGEHANHNRLMLGREAGVIPPLLRLLKHGSSKAKKTAAEALENLALHDWNKCKIVQEGGLECLMQLIKNGTPTEQEAATAILKVVRSGSTSFELGPLQEDLQQSGSRINSGVHIEDLRLNQPAATTIGHTESGEFCKAMAYENGISTQGKEVTTAVACTIIGNELHHSNNQIQGNLQVSKDSSPWQKSFLEMNLFLPGIQSMSTSELTSTFAPPLIGQPSMQVNAIIENAKGPLQSISNSKRMKMTICDNENRNAHVPLIRNNSLGELKSQKFNQTTSLDSNIQMRYLDHNANKRNSDLVAWDKSKEFLYQKIQCNPPNGGYGLSDTIRDQQCHHLVAGGIVALVSALSSPNPSAQEFAALALMLLASQGGFEVKTAISDAGAIPLLITMVDSSTYPMIRESAAAAISKVVSYHPVNRAQVLKGGGIKAMVNMARWSTTLLEDASSVENLKARIQAAAIITVLNIGNVQDSQNTGMGLRDALPVLVHMLQSDDFNELEASVGGLQALNISLGSMVQPLGVKNSMNFEQGSLQTTSIGTIATEMITALLYLTQSSSQYAKAAALEALAGFRQTSITNGLMVFEPRGRLTRHDLMKTSQFQDYIRRDGVHALSTMLTKSPTSARECVTAAFACVMANDKLSIYIMDESTIIQQLMMILEEGPTMATRVSAAASMATMGARKKRLDALSKEHILLLLQVLTSNEYEAVDWEGPLVHGSNTTNNLSGIRLMPHILLREHITAIIVYTALSGDSKKQLLITAGIAPILVGVLKGCLSSPHINTMQGSWQYMPSISKNRGGVNGVPPYLHATQEFATMGLIMLADKSIETIEKIVEIGGISLLVKMLTTTMGCKGKLGANWSEMAAAALLTLAGSNNAREEIVRVGGIASLVQVLKGEGGASGFSLTGLAAMAQLLGVLALNNEETKVHMAEEGVVRCLVEILIGGSNCCARLPPKIDEEQKLEYVALAQEAAAAALATVVLHCGPNAEVAVQAGAIGHLVKLLDPTSILNCNRLCNFELPKLLPSAYKSMRNGISFSKNKATTSKGCSDSKMNSTVVDEDVIQTGSCTGGPLAAMAALGNMVSCYPQCWREIVDAGAAPRLANLLQGGIWINNGEADCSGIPPQLEGQVVCSTKVQESAALVLDLLIDCEENSCSL